MPNDFTLTVDFNARVFKISDQAKANCPRLVNVERIAREIRERIPDDDVMVTIKGPGSDATARIVADYFSDEQLAAALLVLGCMRAVGYGGPTYDKPIDFKSPNGTL